MNQRYGEEGPRQGGGPPPGYPQGQGGYPQQYPGSSPQQPPGQGGYQQPYPGQPQYPGQGGYQQPQYPGQGGYQQPQGYGGGRPPLAEYGQRALAYLIDTAIVLPLVLIAVILYSIGVPKTSFDPVTGSVTSGGNPIFLLLGILFYVATFGVSLWNVGFRQGATGQSIGKKQQGIRLVKEIDGQPLGGGMGIGRLLLRGVLGSISCGIYSPLTLLWPLWDEKRQTLDDKILKTLVIAQR